MGLRPENTPGDKSASEPRPEDDSPDSSLQDLSEPANPIEPDSRLPEDFPGLDWQIYQLVLAKSGDPSSDFKILSEARQSGDPIPSIEFLDEYYRTYRYIPEIGQLKLDATGDPSKHRATDWSNNINFILASMQHFPAAEQRGDLELALSNIVPSCRNALIELLGRYIEYKIDLAGFYEIAKLAPRNFKQRPALERITDNTFNAYVNLISTKAIDELAEMALIIPNLRFIPQPEQKQLLTEISDCSLEAAKNRLAKLIEMHHPGRSGPGYNDLLELYCGQYSEESDRHTQPLLADAMLSYTAVNLVGRELWTKSDLELRSAASQWLTQSPEKRLEGAEARKFFALARELHYRETGNYPSAREMLGILMLYHSRIWERSSADKAKFLAGYAHYEDKTVSMLAIFAAYAVASSAVSRVDIVIEDDQVGVHKPSDYFQFFRILKPRPDQPETGRGASQNKVTLTTFAALTDQFKNGGDSTDNATALLLINGRNISFHSQAIEGSPVRKPDRYPLLERALQFMASARQSAAANFLEIYSKYEYKRAKINMFLDAAQRDLDRLASMDSDFKLSSTEDPGLMIDAKEFLLSLEERAVDLFKELNPEFAQLPMRLIELCLKATQRYLSSYSRPMEKASTQSEFSADIVTSDRIIASYGGAVILDDGDTAPSHAFALQRVLPAMQFQSCVLPGGEQRLPITFSTLVVGNVQLKLQEIKNMARAVMQSESKRLLIVIKGNVELGAVADVIRQAGLSSILLDDTSWNYTTADPDDGIFLVYASQVVNKPNFIITKLVDLSNVCVIDCSNLGARELVGRLGQFKQLTALISLDDLVSVNQKPQLGPNSIWNDISKTQLALGYGQPLENSIYFVRNAQDILKDSLNSMKRRSVAVIQDALSTYATTIGLPSMALLAEKGLVGYLYSRLGRRFLEDRRQDQDLSINLEAGDLEYLDRDEYPEIDQLKIAFQRHFGRSIDAVRLRVAGYNQEDDESQLTSYTYLSDSSEYPARHNFRNIHEYDADVAILRLFNWHLRTILDHHLALKAITQEVVLEELVKTGC